MRLKLNFAKRINKSHKILIGLKSKEQQYFDIYELNLLDYTKKLIMKNNKFVGFLIDNNLNIRVGIYKNNKGEEEYFQFKNNKWVFLMKLTPEDIAYTGFHGFDASGNNIYLLDGCSKGTVTLKLLNLNNGKMKLLAEDAHGGPNRRDKWGMNKEHQWLASRGHAVLSVNFRGSTGFGKSFQNACNGEWGRKMQDDLVDAVNWQNLRYV